MSLGQFLVLQQLAQESLCNAIACERSKRWEKAVENYVKLLRILKTQFFSEHAQMEPHHKQLVYETYYHLGIAFENVNQHRKAVLQYTKALQTSSIKKKSCAAGCTVTTCLHTPVLTRRAFALVKCGETMKALKDADAAVVLDSLNPVHADGHHQHRSCTRRKLPQQIHLHEDLCVKSQKDVYCIRALVWCTMKREEEAIKDLNYGLRFNSSHVCSLILRGNIKKHIGLENNSCLALNDDQEQALQINYSTIRFLGVKDFNSAEMSEFYNMFLWPLNVPHTVICVNLPSSGSSLHLKRASSVPVKPGKGRQTLSCVSFMRFSEKSAVIVRQGEVTDSLSNKLPKCYQRCTKSHRQKTEVCWKIFEATRFPVFERGHPGSFARMYNKPWNGDKLPVNKKAQEQKLQKNVFL